MKISHNWLKMYFDEPIPSPETIRDLLTDHAFEVESLEKVQNDTLIDIKVLPDRAHDCLSHRGIAREVSVLSGVPLKKEVFNPRPFTAPESNILKVEIEDIKLCKRFSALVIDNIEVRESPEWLQDLLETIGQRSINNVVDATNFVMFSLGQPLHAYDKALLTEAHGGYKIVARRAKNGEVVKTLGEKDFTLSTENLVIADANKDAVLGIAAIRGGDATKITKSTTSIVIEAANFDAINIRKTSKQLGLRTDASVRFENDITPELTMRAIQDVTNLLFEIAKTDETQVEGLVDIYPKRVIFQIATVLYYIFLKLI
jgi:phenylalanyl-tRNA synthetase beta chain